MSEPNKIDSEAWNQHILQAISFLTKNHQFRKSGLGLCALLGLYLGVFIGFGISMVFFCPSNWINLGCFFCVYGIFHLFEFLYVAMFRPYELSCNSFLINHSREYLFALGFGLCEYFVEHFFFPGLKNNFVTFYLVLISLCVIFVAQFFRTAAMITAGRNFNHEIEEKKRDDHVLVSSGVYGISRHPSYFGFFYWSIATQLLLLNPISTIGFTIASWRFFRDRIEYEEMTLVSYFGKQYLEYRKKVPVRIPFL